MAESYLSTFLNPFGAFLGTAKPFKFLNAITGNPSGSQGTRLASNAIGVGASAFVVAAAIRGLHYINYVDSHGGNTNLGKEISGQLDRTYNISTANGSEKKQDTSAKAKAESEEESEGAVKNASEHGKQRDTGIGKTAGENDGKAAWISPTQLAMIGLPLATLAAGMYGGYKYADSYLDDATERYVDRRIRKGNGDWKRLMEIRAKIPRGTLSQEDMRYLEQLDKEDPLTKSAGFLESATRGSVSALGLLAVATLATGIVGGYAYGKKNNANNIDFKAWRGAIREYARTKSETAPVQVHIDDNDGMFSRIDTKPDDPAQEEKEAARQLGSLARKARRELAAANVRSEPEVDYDSLNTPISVSL